MKQTTQPSHPIFSFADAEMGPIASHIIRSVEKISGQPKIRKLYFDYVDADLPAANFWSDALDRLGITIDLVKRGWGVHSATWSGGCCGQSPFWRD